MSLAHTFRILLLKREISKSLAKRRRARAVLSQAAHRGWASRRGKTA